MLNDATKKTKSAPKKVIKWLVITVYCLLILFATSSQNTSTTISVRDKSLVTETATTSQEKRRGLCCRQSLQHDSGMLFVYETPGDYRFWMKDTLIPLDIIWIDSAKTIVHIENNVQPSSYPKSFASPTESQYILETNAGWAEKNSIQTGDVATF